jgi:hypothetical protein
MCDSNEDKVQLRKCRPFKITALISMCLGGIIAIILGETVTKFAPELVYPAQPRAQIHCATK